MLLGAGRAAHKRSVRCPLADAAPRPIGASRPQRGISDAGPARMWPTGAGARPRAIACPEKRRGRSWVPIAGCPSGTRPLPPGEAIARRCRDEPPERRPMQERERCPPTRSHPRETGSGAAGLNRRPPAPKWSLRRSADGWAERSGTRLSPRCWAESWAGWGIDTSPAASSIRYAPPDYFPHFPGLRVEDSSALRRRVPRA
jgi:hypothetical protein